MFPNEKPKLIEPGMKYFLDKSLTNCKNIKDKYLNNLFNIGIGFTFILVISLILYFKYKGKPTESELRQKEYMKKQYILNQIKNYQDDKKRASTDLITGLPEWNNEYNLSQNK